MNPNQNKIAMPIFSFYFGNRNILRPELIMLSKTLALNPVQMEKEFPSSIMPPFSVSAQNWNFPMSSVIPNT